MFKENAISFLDQLNENDLITIENIYPHIHNLKRAIKSLNKRMQEHIDKLPAYGGNQDTFDNAGHLKKTTGDAKRQQEIIYSSI